MSAFQVSGKHLAAIIGSALAYRSAQDRQPLGLPEAVVLSEENARSVNTRYRSTDAPVPVVAGEIEAYRLRPVPPVTLLKLINGLDYQSCETDDWATTPARKLLDQIQAIAIRALPGYDDAPWAI